MEYRKTCVLKDGRTCVIRNGTAADARTVLDHFILTHGQTDFLTTYPEETSFTPDQEEEYLRKRADSDREAELVAEIEGRIAGSAGIGPVRTAEKTRHRASFGISIDRAWWGLGIGRALTEACIECARHAGYSQLELEVVAGNERALALYKSVGFAEYGRNPRAFRSRVSGWQENILMRLDLEKERTERVTLTNMCMIVNGTKVLVEEKTGKDAGGITFPGGHVETREPVVDSVIREIREETGLTIRSPRLCGVKDWINEDGSRYVVFLFTADQFSGELASSAEGRVFWLEKDEVLQSKWIWHMDSLIRILVDGEFSELFLDRADGWKPILK